MAGLASNRLFADSYPSKRREILQQHDDKIHMDKYGRLKIPNAYEHDDLKKLTYSNADQRVDLYLDNNREENSESSWKNNVKQNLFKFHNGNQSGEYLKMSKMPS